MPTVRSICSDALNEIGVLAEGAIMDPSQGALCLRRFQNQIDSWAADRLTLSLQLRTVFTLLSGTSSVTLGPVGADVTMGRPVWINSLNYLIPSSSPAVEVPIGQMDEDAYAALSIKQLSSALPIQSFYQTNLTDTKGTLFFWPQVSQNVQIALYTPQAVDVPATLDAVMIGPPGYQEAFMYQLALRLVTPFGVNVSAQCPLLPKMATDAFATMKRPNVDPGILGIDSALVPSAGAGYNILSDGTTAWGGRS